MSYHEGHVDMRCNSRRQLRLAVRGADPAASV